MKILWCYIFHSAGPVWRGPHVFKVCQQCKTLLFIGQTHGNTPVDYISIQKELDADGKGFKILGGK